MPKVRRKKKKRTGLRIVILIIVLAVLYAAYSFFMTLQVQSVIQSSLDGYGENYNEHSQSIASEELYRQLSFQRERSADEYQFSLSPALHWFIGGNVRCEYSYVAYDPDGKVISSTQEGVLDIHVGFKNFLWCITSVEGFASAKVQ